MAVTLKEENVLSQWGIVLADAAGHGDSVLDDIQGILEHSKIPGNCEWSIEEVKAGGWLIQTRRELLIIKLREFKDYRIYVSARDYGVHLDVCWFLTVEPGRFKKMVSSRMVGDPQALSAPKNILLEQDLRAWASIVHHGALQTVDALMEKLEQDPSKIQRTSKGILEIW